MSNRVSNAIIDLQNPVIQSISGIPQEYTIQMYDKLKKENVIDIVLFGSRAKGNFHDGSDIDICLFGNISTQEIWNLSDAVDDLELPWKTDIVAYHLLNSPPCKNIFYE